MIKKIKNAIIKFIATMVYIFALLWIIVWRPISIIVGFIGSVPIDICVYILDRIDPVMGDNS